MAGRLAGKELATHAEAAAPHSLESQNINWRELVIPWPRASIPKPHSFTPASSEGFCEDLIFTLYKGWASSFAKKEKQQWEILFHSQMQTSTPG